MTRSTAALLCGFMDFDPHITIAGIVLNRAGSRRHFEMVRDSLPAGWRRRLFGYPRGQTTIRLAVPVRERAWWRRLWQKILSPWPNCNAVENHPVFTG